MVLLISTTHRPATDLGYLLHKNPGRAHRFELGVGVTAVVFPEATNDRCTAALVLEVDPVGLVRNRQKPSGDGGLFDQYVNDRPYAASSLLCTAMAKAFGTAMTGRCKERPELAEAEIPLEARLPVVAARGGETFLKGLFEPLGYEVECSRLPLDASYPEWGEGRHFDVTIKGVKRIKDLLQHLAVLIPVLDDQKHYWVDEQEIDKLLRKGAGWLSAHPKKEEIARRYLRRQLHLTREALARLVDETDDPDQEEEERASEEQKLERPISLHDQRLSAVLSTLKESKAKKVLDMGCGEGRLLQLLLKERQFEKIVGMDVSYSALEKAHRRLKVERLSPNQAKRLELIQGSLMYRDKRLDGYDAAAIVEVIEHLDPPRLAAFERIVFEFARPRTVVITTPNREYNALFENLPEDGMRHRDHRFEWTRGEFRAWTEGVVERHAYGVKLLEIGPQNAKHGAPTQMAVFER
ncbi:MAG: 3' terminal RNA ribose 2'-O-methyltransferase Hen1 [Armatimonadetes bacterium]|nr:3' terminal RNA ribose 2'-O-methyltransferase Hen1 [Armatimonadota bacterium]